MRFFYSLLTVLSLLGLQGCASNRSPLLETMQTLLDTGGTGVAEDAIPAAPDLRYRYLRVEVEGHPPGLMVLGYEDPHPLGVIEVWYSGTRETLRLQNGRVVGLTGALQDWHTIAGQSPAPHWPSITAQGAHYERRRDHMPGYRFGLVEHLQVSAWPGPPPLKLPAALHNSHARGYQWYRETAELRQGREPSALPDAWFAWGKHRGQDTVVYSEQCLSATYCLKLLRWPLLDDAP